MRSPVENRLEVLRHDFASVAGKPFGHFYCPITHLDRATALCRGHIVPQTFQNSARDWVVQRKDVGGFYGATFEAGFAAILYKEGGTPARLGVTPLLLHRRHLSLREPPGCGCLVSPSLFGFPRMTNPCLRP